MPIDYSRYPANWREISQRIRNRAHNRCEWCSVPNGALILRSQADGSKYLVYDLEKDCHYYPDGTAVRLSEIPEEYAMSNHIKVVLTVAHLDHDTTNNDDTNLKSLCQRCHLRHDAKLHAQHAAETREREREKLQPRLLP